MKRFFDIFLSLTALVFLSPILLILAALVWINLGPPILFAQSRPGRRGRVFTMWKFRTMTDRRAPSGQPLSDAERLTPFGQHLRSTSLDELPELWNVLRGDMSLVGPRPLLVKYLPRYSREEARRHEVRPGLTGWAQVNGRNATTWEERLQMDVWYIDHRSLWLDLRIIVTTVSIVLRRDGVHSADSATMPEFRPPSDSAQPESPRQERGISDNRTP